MLINDIERFQTFLLNFIAPLWQQDKIQRVDKKNIIIYSIKTVLKERKINVITNNN